MFNLLPRTRSKGCFVRPFMFLLRGNTFDLKERDSEDSWKLNGVLTDKIFDDIFHDPLVKWVHFSVLLKTRSIYVRSSERQNIH